MIKNAFLTYFDKKKYLAKKSFSVYNAVLRRPNKHTKIFLDKMIYYFFLSRYNKMDFLSFQNPVGLVNKGNFVQ